MKFLPANRFLFALGFVFVVAFLVATCSATADIDNELARDAPDASKQSARSRFTLPRLFNFEIYKTAFKKHYASLLDEAARAKLFLARAFRAFVSAVSYKHRKTSSYLAINQMSDWTPEEVRRLYSRSLKNVHRGANINDESGEPVIPAVNFDELKHELDDIVEHGDNQPDIRRFIAEELTSESSRLRERRDTSTTASQRPISLDDIARRPSNAESGNVAAVVGQYVESNNPNYRPPELISHGASATSKPIDPLTTRMRGLLEGSGMDFLTWVLGRADERVYSNGGGSGTEQTKNDEPVGLPDEIFSDYRNDGCMFPPRDQGKCGSCYAFASMALYEWLYCKATGKKVALSEQYLIDCGEQFGMNGCDGGYYQDVPEFVHKQGLELRSKYPYREKSDQCPYTKFTSPESMGYLRVTTSDKRYIPLADMEKELILKGPMLITLFVNDNFGEYGGGVDDGVGCNSDQAHAILLVGSGREDDQEYWLMKNSYSEVFGERGYYKLNKKAENCIEDQEAFFVGGLTAPKNLGINRSYRSNAVQHRFGDYHRNAGKGKLASPFLYY